MGAQRAEMARAVKHHGLIAIIRGKFTRQQILGIAETLLANQFPVVEVTLNTTGATAFLLAARTKDAELMRLLAELGADPLLTNEDGSTPLMVAAGIGTSSPLEDPGTEPEVLEAVKVAVQLGGDVNAVDKKGETAMHGAAYKNLPEAVKFLASKGARADVWNARNQYGWTPLTIARGYRFGNFKPSPVTVAALEAVMTSAGVRIPTIEEENPKGYDIYAPENQKKLQEQRRLEQQKSAPATTKQ